MSKGYQIAVQIPYSDLKVSVLGGVELQPIAGANTASQTYNLTGTTDGNEFAVVATFRSGDKELYAGGIWAATYQQKNFNLYIVPLPGVKVDTAIGWVQNGINIIYSQAVVRWNVQPLYGFTGVELGDNGLDWADKQMLSAYNKEMNSVIKEFKHWKSNADKDAYYLFVVPSFSENSVEGFMLAGAKVLRSKTFSRSNPANGGAPWPPLRICDAGPVNSPHRCSLPVPHSGKLRHVREAALLQAAGAAKVQAEQSRLRRESFCPKAYLQ